VRVFPPEKRKGGIRLEDVEPKEAARQLVEFLAKKGAI
jgi:electron transfer flavoprotein alpha/beta subunit